MLLQAGRHVHHQRQGRREFGAAFGAGLGRGLAIGRQRGNLGDFPGLLVDDLARAAQQHEADRAHGGRQGEESEGGHARNQAHAQGDRRCDQQGAGLGQHLGADILADVGGAALAGLHAGHDDACADGDEQRRDLGDQAVADGQDGIHLHGFAGGQPALHRADQDAAQQVHRHDDEARDGIALDELHGAVHGAVELAFLFDHAAAFARFVHVDRAGAQVGIDGHLLARHGVQGKTGRNLGHALGALGDDHELHDGQDQKDDQADDQVAADHEIAEGLDDVAGIALQQDQARGGDGDAQAEQGGDQQHRGERRERQRRGQIHGHHQQDGRQGHVGADQHVHQRGGQRQDHHEDDRDDQHGQNDVVAAGEERDGAIECLLHGVVAQRGSTSAACCARRSM